MPRNTQLQNVGGSDGNLGPLDFQSSAVPLEPCKPYSFRELLNI